MARVQLNGITATLGASGFVVASLLANVASGQSLRTPESVYPPIEPGSAGNYDDTHDDRDSRDAFGRSIGGLHLDLSATYFTDYVFRGVERFDAVGSSPRPEDTANYQFDTKLSFDLGKVPHPYVDIFVNVGENDPVSSFQEVRPTFGFDWPIKPFILSAGHSNYIFPDRSDLDTAEVFARLQFDDSQIFRTDQPLLNPYVLAAYDYDQYDGLYLEAGIRPTYKVENTGLSFTLDAHVSYVSGFRGLFASMDPTQSENGFQHYQVGLIGQYNLNTLLNIPSRFGQWSVTGYVYYTDGIESEMTADTQLWGGAGISLRY
ncbi:MAG: hypothetical protein QM770_03145 [Tepidisphaeraceae bacterium]